MLTCTIQKGSIQGVSMHETLSKLDSWFAIVCLLKVVNHDSNIVYNYFKINGCKLMNVLHNSLPIRWQFNLLFYCQLHTCTTTSSETMSPWWFIAGINQNLNSIDIDVNNFYGFFPRNGCPSTSTKIVITVIKVICEKI